MVLFIDDEDKYPLLFPSVALVFPYETSEHYKRYIGYRCTILAPLVVFASTRFHYSPRTPTFAFGRISLPYANVQNLTPGIMQYANLVPIGTPASRKETSCECIDASLIKHACDFLDEVHHLAPCKDTLELVEAVVLHAKWGLNCMTFRCGHRLHSYD